MSSATRSADNPLGLNLDFMFGRGYLWAERQRLEDWIAVESLRMEIPDLQFPFDARGGLDRFRDTRCLVREIEVAISEVGLGDLLGEAADRLDGFQDLEVRFLDDAAHVSVRLSSLGTDTYVSFRAALIPPEPARADEVHLSLYDYRAYGPLPYPARLVVHELLTGLLETPTLEAPGRGESFTVGVAGDIVRFRPLKLLLLHLFPKVGWKLPNLSGVVLQSAKIRPGVLTLRAVDESPDSGAGSDVESDGRTSHELAASGEGARALAAYEAKELFAHADQALFDGQIRQALSLLSNYRDAYGLHPGLVARLLDCLVAEASPANLAEAESIRRELVEKDPDDLQAHLITPILALARRRTEEAIEAFQELADRLRDREQTRDWMLCELALADLIADDDPEEAADRLRDVVKRDPQHRVALEKLRELYDRIDRRAGLEETLKRLTGVYTDRDLLKETYLELAHHLMDRQGDLAEARMYLEKVLRLDATELDALHALGESYVMGGEPLRALKAFGSAARSAESEERRELAGRLFLRVGTLWHEEMEDARQALLAFQRAVTALGEVEESPEADLTRALREAARMCEQLDRDEKAAEYWSEAVQILERRAGRTTGDFDTVEAAGDFDWHEERVRAHRRLGRLYDRRDRPSAAARHFRRVLEVEPGDREALEWLETHLKQGGRPEDLVELYQSQIEEVDDDRLRLRFTERLGDLYRRLDLVEDARSRYREILDADPGRDEVRRKLVELLRDDRRFETLRRILRELRETARTREARYEIEMELGAAAEAVDDLEEACAAYCRAARLRTGDREALEEACRTLEAFVERRGHDAEAPVEAESAGRLCETMLVRLAEVVPSAGREREVLLKVAMMADERGDSAAAAEARQRADALRGPAGDGDFEGVDDRLDAMLDEIGGSEPGGPDEPDPDGDDGSSSAVELPTPSGTAEAGDEPGAEPAVDGDEPATRRVEIPADGELPRPDTADSESRDGETASEAPDGEMSEEEVESFRRRFASMKQNPSELPDPDELEEKSALGDEPAPGPEDVADPPPAEESDQPETLRMSADQFETLREESSVPEIDEGSPDADRPSSPARSTESEGFEGDDGWSMSFSKTLVDEDSEADTSPDVRPVEMAQNELEEARTNGDPRRIAEAIDHLLSLADGGETEVLDDREIAILSKEAGELYYYELQEEAAARPHLERVRRLDPDGEGDSPAVLNALESIYEETGDADSRIGLLEQRLEHADSAEMETTYRLLLAQAHWNERDDAEAAIRWLDEVLEIEENHEAAHRLWAEIAEEREDWEEAADHLGVVVDAGSGGLEAVETRRRLATLLLRRLEAPKRAAEHYERVLEASPGDGRALEGLKEALGVVGDWAEYVESLGRELGLLIGEPGGLEADEMADLDPSSMESEVQVPASRIVADAAHVVEEELEDPSLARRLWGVAQTLWPEHAEALERRIALDRVCEVDRDLARDLESYAGLVLDDRDRYDALVEAADIRARSLDEPDEARRLYTEALALVDDGDEAPGDIGEVRRRLDGLDS